MLFFCFLIFLIGVFVVSFSTKAAHIDSIDREFYKETVKQFPEVYRSMEGVLALDVIMTFTLFVAFILVCAKSSAVKVLGYLLVLALIAWIIVGIIFLAGEDDLGRKRVKDFYDLESDLRNDQPDVVKTFVGAWVYQIIELIVGVPIGLVVAILLIKNK